MDSRTRRLVQQIDAYMENPPPGAPEQLLSSAEELKDKLTAPIYDNESPGEKAAREVAEKALPEDVEVVEEDDLPVGSPGERATERASYEAQMARVES